MIPAVQWALEKRGHPKEITKRNPDAPIAYETKCGRVMHPECFVDWDNGYMGLVHQHKAIPEGLLFKVEENKKCDYCGLKIEEGEEC